jgi:hypothetical protein
MDAPQYTISVLLHRITALEQIVAALHAEHRQQREQLE